MENQQSKSFRKAPPHGGASSVYSGFDDEIIAKAAEFLHKNDVVAVPTETVYGLAANALDATACQKIFNIKGRPLIDPLIVHVPDLESINPLAHVPSDLNKIAQAFWPGPLTVVLNKKAIIPSIITAGLNTVAIRIPKHPVMQSLLQKAKIPLAAPSANPFGYVSPTTAQHVVDSLGDKIHLVLDGGSCEVGIESTILDLSNPSKPKILRPGIITQSAIERVLGKPCPISKKAAITAPGMLDQHYSPNTRLALFNDTPEPNDDQANHAWVYFCRNEKNLIPKLASCFWLSETNNTTEAAQLLFALMRKLDQQGFTKLLFQRPPQSEIGYAINDRLQRAAAKSTNK